MKRLTSISILIIIIFGLITYIWVQKREIVKLQTIIIENEYSEQNLMFWVSFKKGKSTLINFEELVDNINADNVDCIFGWNVIYQKYEEDFDIGKNFLFAPKR